MDNDNILITKNINDIIIINEKISILEQDLKNLVELFKNMNELVNVQSITISSIQDSIVDITFNTENSVEKLEDINTWIGYRRTILATFGSLSVLIGVILII